MLPPLFFKKCTLMPLRFHFWTFLAPHSTHRIQHIVVNYQSDQFNQIFWFPIPILFSKLVRISFSKIEENFFIFENEIQTFQTQK